MYYLGRIDTRKTGVKVRPLSTPVVVRKQGWKISLPTKCFYAKTGLMKPAVLKAMLGYLTFARLEYLRETFDAEIELDTERKGA